MINNKKTEQGAHIEELRSAIEHRATWFALLVEEARKRGLDLSFARDAIYRCGAFHGESKLPRTDDLGVFTDAFLTENIKKIFEMETEVTKDQLTVTFHYCPLVAAWQKLGVSEEDIAEYCDIAMDGDRGIVSTYENFEYRLGDTIAKGCNSCQLFVTKKKDSQDK
ncbi:L-2-amino-thiazoline-4-carboxylic acid hydrolase [Mobilitalea sibirica]|uniref:L-2-amino-thiazoline-4-carboxylic acid hydrolase n=1 Tax=Mobilitalea sibirica TaxID=1462919 RepID=A0A8J7H4Z2_9FIRM|nr:L-2-amino-thiazoline-4-carboxylic acid hydrolase [Mobilitalea sibirica]MBH1942182.1 L-2-amino-thiazoline-4-carboxylic acid hydrolase [Mobilitalea sibirica]